jgi:hypothetical protein
VLQEFFYGIVFGLDVIKIFFPLCFFCQAMKAS